MRRFTFILSVIALVCLIAALIVRLISFDPLTVQEKLTSDGSFDPLSVYASAGIGTGLFIAGLTLLLCAFIFYLCEKNIIKLFQWSLGWFFLTIIGVQSALSLIYISQVEYTPAYDFKFYHQQAINIINGSGIVNIWGEPTAYWPIGYSFLLAPFFALFGSKLIVAQALNLILIAIIILLTYLLSKALFDKKIARCSALIIAFLPSWIFFSLIPIADIPFTLAITSMMLLLIRKASLFNEIFIGLLFGVAMLMRPVVLFLPVLFFLYRMVRDKKWKAALVQLIIIFALGEAVMLPWQIRNYNAFNRFVLVSTNGGRHVWMGNNDRASGGYLDEQFYVPPETWQRMLSLDEAERDQFAFKQGVNWALNHPLKAVLLWPKKLIQFYYRDSKCITYGLQSDYETFSPSTISAMIFLTEGYYYALFIAFLIGGFYFIRRDKLSNRSILISGMILYFTVIHFPFVAEGRYHMPLMPLFAILVCLPVSVDSSNRTKKPSIITV